MNRDRIKSLGSEPINGNDAYAILGIVFDWIEGKKNGAFSPLIQTMASPDELEELLREAGYYFE